MSYGRSLRIAGQHCDGRGHHQHRVAVRRRGRDDARSRSRRCAPPRLSTMTFWPRLCGHLLRDDARHEVGAAAGCEADDQPDRLGGIGLSRAWRRSLGRDFHGQQRAGREQYDGIDAHMKIATYNVNGVNGRLPRLLDWLKETRAGHRMPSGDQDDRREMSGARDRSGRLWRRSGTDSARITVSRSLPKAKRRGRFAAASRATTKTSRRAISKRK